MSMKKESVSDLQLHRAATTGNLPLLKKLLDSGKVHVDNRDKDGTTPLILASVGDHLECVQELLEQGADPNVKRLTGTTALFFASQSGYLDVVRLLLDNGAEVDAASVDGGTPLFVASQCGHIGVVKELVTRGADIHCTMKDRATPLFIATQNGHLKVSLYLLSRGAQVDFKRADGATPLWIASQMGHASVVKHLLLAGADVDATRQDGATPLFKAAHKGHLEVVEELLKFKPNIGLLKNGESALHAAALFGHLYVAKVLMAAGVNPVLRNQDNLTPLQLAQNAGHLDVVEYLKRMPKPLFNGTQQIQCNGTPRFNSTVK